MAKRFLFNVIGIVIAAFAGLYLLFQQHKMQGRFDEMQAWRRPSVVISDIVTTNDLVFDDAGVQVPIGYKIENQGAAPVLEATLFFDGPGGLKAEPLPRPEEMRKWIGCGTPDRPATTNKFSAEIGTLIPAGGKSNTQQTVLSTGKYVDEGFLTDVWAPVCIRYKDSHGEYHANGFLLVFSPVGGGEKVLPASTVKGTFKVAGRGYVIY